MNAKLDVGQVTREVFDIYRDQAAVLLPAAAAVFLVEALIRALLLSADLIGSLLAFAVTIIAITFYTGMVVELVRDVQDGRRDSSVGDLFRAVTPVLLPLIAVGLLRGLGVGLGFVLLIVPGLFLLTIWAVVAPAVLVERKGVFDAFGRSRELVRGNGWPVFGAIVIFILINLVVSAILGGIGAAAGGVGLFIGSFIASVLTAPLSALVAAVLYFQLRGATEGAGATGATAPAGGTAVGEGSGQPAPPTQPERPVEPQSPGPPSGPQGPGSPGGPSSPGSTSGPQSPGSPR